MAKGCNKENLNSGPLCSEKYYFINSLEIADFVTQILMLKYWFKYAWLLGISLQFTFLSSLVHFYIIIEDFSPISSINETNTFGRFYHLS